MAVGRAVIVLRQIGRSFSFKWPCHLTGSANLLLQRRNTYLCWRQHWIPPIEEESPASVQKPKTWGVSDSRPPCCAQWFLLPTAMSLLCLLVVWEEPWICFDVFLDYEGIGPVGGPGDTRLPDILWLKSRRHRLHLIWDKLFPIFCINKIFFLHI